MFWCVCERGPAGPGETGLGGWWVATARDADGALRSTLSRVSLRSIVPAVAGAIPAGKEEETKKPHFLAEMNYCVVFPQIHSCPCRDRPVTYL